MNVSFTGLDDFKRWQISIQYHRNPQIQVTRLHTCKSHVCPWKALPLMVNDSSFTFDLMRRPYNEGFCLSVTVVILVWESGLVVEHVGVHVSCHL